MDGQDVCTPKSKPVKPLAIISIFNTLFPLDGVNAKRVIVDMSVKNNFIPYVQLERCDGNCAVFNCTDWQELVMKADSEALIRVHGTPVYPGTVLGRACVILNLDEISNLQVGDVLITHSTDIGWTPYFPMLGGVVTELGGLISHGAVVAREYGLPCVIGAQGATSFFQTVLQLAPNRNANPRIPETRKRFHRLKDTTHGTLQGTPTTNIHPRTEVKQTFHARHTTRHTNDEHRTEAEQADRRHQISQISL
uniref:PEP-utilising enzyme mobile domain-containing protein n=1 Tax=Timema monikensis TaxID=170555 RepID=A0A7R9EFM8_9NEOP|nr:unnamed protein product [Timema monikensis]